METGVTQAEHERVSAESHGVCFNLGESWVRGRTYVLERSPAPRLNSVMGEVPSETR